MPGPNSDQLIKKINEGGWDLGIATFQSLLGDCEAQLGWRILNASLPFGISVLWVELCRD